MSDQRDDVRKWVAWKHDVETIVSDGRVVLETTRPEDRDRVLAMRDALAAFVDACSFGLSMSALAAAFDQAKTVLGEKK